MTSLAAAAAAPNLIRSSAVQTRAQKMRAVEAAGKCTTSRRQIGVQLLLVPAVVHLASFGRAAASEVPENDSEQDQIGTDAWDEYRGEGFVLKIPPGFEDTMETEDIRTGVPEYGEKVKTRAFAARFATSDREESVSVVIRRTSQLRPTFFAAKSITDLGKIEDVSKLFLPVGARLTGFSSRAPSDSRVYYHFEYRVAEKHVFVSAAAVNGQVFVAAATAPQSRWDMDGAILRSSAASFAVL